MSRRMRFCGTVSIRSLSLKCVEICGRGKLVRDSLPRAPLTTVDEYYEEHAIFSRAEDQNLFLQQLRSLCAHEFSYSLNPSDA